ncbi:MAG: hypothetical protein ACK40L_10025, partial [Hydrogenophaga sp.]
MQHQTASRRDECSPFFVFDAVSAMKRMVQCGKNPLHSASEFPVHFYFLQINQTLALVFLRGTGFALRDKRRFTNGILRAMPTLQPPQESTLMKPIRRQFLTTAALSGAALAAPAIGNA